MNAAAHREKYKTDPAHRAAAKQRSADRYKVKRAEVLAQVASRYQQNKPAIQAYRADSYQRNSTVRKQRAARRARDNKIKAVMVKGGRCERCDFAEHPAAFQFHHRDPKTKSFNVSVALNTPRKFPWSVVLLEIAKCDLLCANCHSIVGSTWDLTDSDWIQ